MYIDDFDVAASNTPAMGSSSALLLWCLLQLAPSNSSDARDTKSDVDECVQGLLAMESRMSDDPRPILVDSDGEEAQRRKKRFVIDGSGSASTYVKDLHRRCTRDRSARDVERQVKKDRESSSRKPRSNKEEPAHKLFADAWDHNNNNRTVWDKKKNLRPTELTSLQRTRGSVAGSEGSLTDVSKRAVIVYSQTWRGRQSFYERFRLETLPPTDRQHTVANYPFCGAYAALYTLPRVKFQLPMQRVAGHPFVSFAETFRRQAFNWARIVLARGSKTNYFQSASRGTVFRFGSFTSFTSTFQIAINFANPPQNMRNPSPTFIFIYEAGGPAFFARPIGKLSMFDDQEEYLIDPVTKFQIVDIFDGIEVGQSKIKSKFVIIKHLP